MEMIMKFSRLLALLAATFQSTASQAVDLEKVMNAVNGVEDQVIAWRRDIHQHPELSNMEYRTAGLVAEHLKSLGLEVRTGIAKTGVVGVLKGAKPGPVIALRADMDALPIKESTGLPFASEATAEYAGKTVSVMHACGHDAHTAILMGAASVLAGMKDDIAGTVLFVFQPAEEGAPPGETGGAPRMLAEGVFDALKPKAMFALHVEPGPVGLIDVRADGFLAGATIVTIGLQGEGTHAARPWGGTDLVELSADIVKALPRISTRQVNILQEPTVLSIGSLNVGNRSNILAGAGELSGTLRTYSTERREAIKSQIENTVHALARTYEAKAEVTFSREIPPTVNDGALLKRVLPALQAAAGVEGVDTDATRRSAAEDFAFFAQEIPSVYYILGSTPNFKDYASAPANHSPRFDIDEKVLAIGVKAQVLTALTYGEEAVPE